MTAKEFLAKTSGGKSFATKYTFPLINEVEVYGEAAAVGSRAAEQVVARKELMRKNLEESPSLVIERADKATESLMGREYELPILE